MTIIIPARTPLETTSMLCTTSTIEDTVQDPDLASTTISALAASVSTQMYRPAVIHMDYANRYIDSLSVEQLCEMEQLLEQKEDEFTLLELDNKAQQEKPKVYEMKKL